MTDPFHNVYEDATRAEAYAGLEFPGTYYLAYRDLPAILRQHVRGTRALDFGCGAGRSSRFLRGLGFQVIGVDISEAMLARARARDPEGTYLLVHDDTLLDGSAGAFDLILAAFTFDNIPTREAKLRSFRALGRLLAPDGVFVTLASTPEIYVHEWASFSTQAFPENRAAKSGDRVRIVMLDVPDRRPVEDVVCSDPEYRELYRAAALRLVETHRPLGRPDEPYSWVSETTVSPWAIYVLRHDAGRPGQRLSQPVDTGSRTLSPEAKTGRPAAERPAGREGGVRRSRPRAGRTLGRESRDVVPRRRSPRGTTGLPRSSMADRSRSAPWPTRNMAENEMNDRDVEIGQIAITVSDVAQALPFYRDVLGLKFLFSPARDLAFLAAGPVRIMLTTPQGSGTVGANSILYFKVSGIETTHRAMVEKGAASERAPQLTARLPDHELWIGFLRDPDGNLVGLMEEKR